MMIGTELASGFVRVPRLNERDEDWEFWVTLLEVEAGEWDGSLLRVEWTTIFGFEFEVLFGLVRIKKGGRL